ncbi:MAG TPA: hypothetical protein VE546_13060, partial [Streptomyces sp.]|nr:hypothetical protein [Streptomyces sp.]
SAAGWDTTRFKRLNDWVAHRLAQDYPTLAAPKIRREVCEELVEERHVLPVLDGLDELPPAALTAAVTALSESCAGDAQLILTCHATEYERAVRGPGKPFTSELVIEPDDLTPEDAATYLDRCLHVDRGASWDRVLEALRAPVPADGPVAPPAEVTASPLGLWLVRTAYEHSGPGELLEPGRHRDADDLRVHLFDALIPALVRHRRPGGKAFERSAPRRRHDPDDVRRWLGYLASLTPDTPELAWWRLARAGNAITAATSCWFGLLTAVAATLALAGAAALFFSPVSGIAGSVVFGASTGWAAGMAAGHWPESEPGYARPRLRGRLSDLARAVLTNMVTGLKVSIPIGCLLAALGARPMAVLLGLVLVAPLVHGLTSGFMEWAETPSHSDQPLTPLDHLEADRRLGLLRMRVFGLGYGLTVALGIGCFHGVAPALVIGLIGAMAAAFATGVLHGDHHAWLAFSVATVRLSRRGHLPRPLMPFLDDAHRLGLLRAVGPVYRFRHQALRQHLARAHRAAESAR